MKKLEQSSSDVLSSFELLDGSRYFYAPGAAIFMHSYDCVGKNPHDWPEPPEVLGKLCEAKDMRVAFEAVMGGGTDSFVYDDIFPYDPEVLVNERRLEPRSLIAGRAPYDQEVADLSE